MPRSKSLVKITLLVAVAAGLGFLFIRSAQSTRSEPYTVGRDLLRNWTVAFEPAASATAPVLVLRPPAELTSTSLSSSVLADDGVAQHANGAGDPACAEG